MKISKLTAASDDNDVPVTSAIDEIELALSYEDERDRLRLERQVERAFYLAGCALRELRDRKLYRSTHKTFEQYCQERFGMMRRHPYRLIDAAIVVDNIIQMLKDNVDL